MPFPGCLLSLAISNTEKDLNHIISNLLSESEKLSHQLNFNPDEEIQTDLDKNANLIDIIVDNDSKIYTAKEHQIVLAEMKIIYVFKNLEIKIKSLLQIAYPQIKVTDFYRWESIVSVLKGFEIRIADYDGYKEVLELHKVNNNLKHSNFLNDELKKITEFTDLSTFDYKSLNIFHDRVIKKIDSFYKILIQDVIDELYNFDNERLEKICNNFKEKMDKETLIEFIYKLRSKL